MSRRKCESSIWSLTQWENGRFYLENLTIPDSEPRFACSPFVQSSKQKATANFILLTLHQANGVSYTTSGSYVLSDSALAFSWQKANFSPESEADQVQKTWTCVINRWRPLTFSVNKIVQWWDESPIPIRKRGEGAAPSEQTKKTRLLTGFGAVMTTLISSVHKADGSQCDSAGRAGFYTRTLAVDSFPSVQPFFSPSLHPSSPFSKSSLLSENNPAIRCVNKQDHELISRTSQSHRPTWRQFSLICLSIFHSLWSLVIKNVFSYLNGLAESNADVHVFIGEMHLAERRLCAAVKAELIHGALCRRGNMADEKWRSSVSWDRGIQLSIKRVRAESCSQAFPASAPAPSIASDRI